MNKKMGRKKIRTMDRIVIGLLVVGLLINFVSVRLYLIPDMFISKEQGEKTIRSCFEEANKILASYGIDMTTAEIEEGDLFHDDVFEMYATIDVDENVRLEFSIYQSGRIPYYNVTLYRYGEVKDTSDFIDVADYPYVYELADYFGDCYRSDSLLKAVQKQRTAAIKQWEEDGGEVYAFKQYTRFFVQMEWVGFAYVCEADDPPPYQYITIVDYMRAK